MTRTNASAASGCVSPAGATRPLGGRLHHPPIGAPRPRWPAPRRPAGGAPPARPETYPFPGGLPVNRLARHGRRAVPW